MPVRDDPDSVGQLPRMAAYRLAHPRVEIYWMGAAWGVWQAVVHEDDGDGMTIVTKSTLRALMDKLESLAAAGPAEPPAANGAAGR